MRIGELTRRTARVAIAAAAMASLGGCMHISQRAIANGQYIDREGTAIYGNYSLQQARESYSQLDPLPFKHQAYRPYTFGFKSR